MQLIFTIHNIEFHTHREITRVYNNSQKSHSPVNRPVDQKQITTEIIYTPAFSL